MRKAIGAALAAIAAAACAAPVPETQAPPSLAATRWVAADDAKLDRANIPRLEFSAEGRVIGFTGCNLLNGSYVLEGDRLDVLAATTKRGCMGAPGEAEAKLLAVLADKPRVKLSARSMLLTGAKGGSVEFRAAPD